MCVISTCVLQLQVEDEQGVSAACAESGLTLRRLLVWMYDPKVRLKTLAALVDFCQGGSAPELLANAFCLLTSYFFQECWGGMVEMQSHPRSPFPVCLQQQNASVINLSSFHPCCLDGERRGGLWGNNSLW